MLCRLEIRNVALIENIRMELGEGLNILTGETGAGKSILIDSINAILGERLSKELIRTGADKAVVEAVFQTDRARVGDILEKTGIEPEEDGTLILSREFSATGRNTCRVNGKLVTASVLKDIGEHILDIHGQHDNQSLLKPENHLALLDSFGGDGIRQLKQEYSALLFQYRSVKNRLKELSGDTGEREKKIDLLKFQIDEIKKAGLKPGEEEQISKKRLKLTHAEKIINSLACAYELLSGDHGMRKPVQDLLNEALSELKAVSRLQDNYRMLAERLEDVIYQVGDITEEIRRERENVEFNPGLLEQLEERADLIYRLKRKYGSTVSEIFAYCQKAEEELYEILQSEKTVLALNEEASVLKDKLYSLAQKMHNERVKAAEVLEMKIGRELEDLEMKRARFKVEIEFPDNPGAEGDLPFSQDGLDRAEFLISPNVGEPLKSLARIASGGETARIMLAIKTILADVDRIPTLIFDEIDMGVSGKVAQRIGEKLSFISQKHQVICVTHLAQIACMADNHYLIEKVTEKGRTSTILKKLSGEQVRDEIARILGGAVISEITRQHAREMLDTASQLKKFV